MDYIINADMHYGKVMCIHLFVM